MINSIDRVRDTLTQSLKNSQLPLSAEFLNLIKSYPTSFYDRHNPEGHITTSTFVVNTARDKILLVYHKKHQEWLQPGGHVDSPIMPFDNALKELSEEAFGDKNFDYKVLHGHQIFHLDIHGVGTHQHYDLSYLLEVSGDCPLHVSHESEDVQWVSIDDVINNPQSNKSLAYVCRKIKSGVY